MRLLTLLAQPLVDPELDGAAWSAAVAEELRGLDVPVPPAWPTSTPTPAEFAATFVAPGCPLHPVESVYKPWTTLPGATLPFAREKGWLGGDAAAHLRALYASAGIVIPSAFAATPDHLALELEFFGLLLESGLREQAQLFRAQHLDWVGDLAADARVHGVPAGYQQLFDLIVAVLKQV